MEKLPALIFSIIHRPTPGYFRNSFEVMRSMQYWTLAKVQTLTPRCRPLPKTQPRDFFSRPRPAVQSTIPPLARARIYASNTPHWLAVVSRPINVSSTFVFSPTMTSIPVDTDHGHPVQRQTGLCGDVVAHGDAPLRNPDTSSRLQCQFTK